MVQNLWTVENELCLMSNQGIVKKFTKTIARSQPEEKPGNKTIIPIGISTDNNTTVRSIQGEVVDVQDKCTNGCFARLVMVFHMESTTLSLSDLEDRLLAKGWRKIP